MKEKEFVHITNELRRKSLQICKGYDLGTEEAEDIAQETMLKLWKVRDDILSEEHAYHLTARITKHLCLDHGRKQKAVSLLVKQVLPMCFLRFRKMKNGWNRRSRDFLLACDKCFCSDRRNGEVMRK